MLPNQWAVVPWGAMEILLRMPYYEPHYVSKHLQDSQDKPRDVQ